MGQGYFKILRVASGEFSPACRWENHLYGRTTRHGSIRLTVPSKKFRVNVFSE
jgi:hypothetical protein